MRMVALQGCKDLQQALEMAYGKGRRRRIEIRKWKLEK
jgi:hypothetical protein